MRMLWRNCGRRVALLLLACGVAALAQAQVFYETEWEDGGITYRGLMKYNDENDAHMRIGFSKAGKQFIAAFECYF